jgi:hypothetical protein
LIHHPLIIAPIGARRQGLLTERLLPEPSAFGIEPSEPFGNPTLLLSNLVHRSHLLYPLSLLDTEDDVIASGAELAPRLRYFP